MIGKVPTLQLDDGSSIYDSLTICDYLIATYSPEWGIKQQNNFWEYRTRLSMLNEMSDVNTGPEIANSRATATTADFQLSKIHRGLAHIENTWISPSELSLVSIGLGCTFDWLLNFPEINWVGFVPEDYLNEFKLRRVNGETHHSGSLL